MADLRNMRSRPGVRIYLHSADIADVVTQPDVMEWFTTEELELIIGKLNEEKEKRK